MHWFMHRTRLFETHRLLPGHATVSPHRGDDTPLPGSVSSSRRIRRETWTQQHTRRFDRTELTGRIGLALSVAVMVMVTLMAISSPTHVLERSQAAQLQQMQNAAPIVQPVEAPPAA